MSGIDLGAVFVPNRRLKADDFLLGLGLIALIDAVRLSVLPGGLLVWLPVLFFTACAMMNRLRDAGRSPALVIAPLGAAVLAKTLVAFFAFIGAMYPDFVRFLEERGIDMNDPVAVQNAAYDPALQQAYTERVSSSPELMQTIATAGDWPSTWAFWIVIAVFAAWLRKLPSRPYAVN